MTWFLLCISDLMNDDINTDVIYIKQVTPICHKIFTTMSFGQYYAIPIFFRNDLYNINIIIPMFISGYRFHLSILRFYNLPPYLPISIIKTN